MKEKAIMKIDLPFPQLGKGGNKIREMYDLSKLLPHQTQKIGLMVNTDRISAGDVVMLTGIPGKGKVLTTISAEIFKATAPICPNHFISDKFEEFPEEIQQALLPYKEELSGRSMLIKLSENVMKAEAIVRFCLTGSGYRSYEKTGEVCGIKLPPGLRDGDRLSAPIFTPSTKAPIGQHDEPLTFKELAIELGHNKFPSYESAGEMRAYSISLASEISTLLAVKRIKLVDTKFEFGIIDSTLYQIDETATPDSSRYEPDYSKQPFREAIRKIGFDGETPMEIPSWLVEETSRNYRKMCQLITGKDIV